MTPPLPGSYEHFFAEIQQFLKQNAQGSVDVVIITSTGTQQFWISSSSPNRVLLAGMLKQAMNTIDNDYMIRMMEKFESAQEELEQQKLGAMKTEGKTQ